MFVFIIGLERSGTHSAANIIKTAINVSAHIVHEEEPTLCKEARLIYEEKDFRTKDFKSKIAKYHKYKKQFPFVCEANHRLSFFPTLLMREFYPYCKFVLLIRDPIATIISRISTWAHYKEFLYKYPSSYIDETNNNVLLNKKCFNEFRLSPPSSYSDKNLGELYCWEWLETYKYVRKELQTIPQEFRKVMVCDELTTKFEDLFNFIGTDYFKINQLVKDCVKVKSDSVSNGRNMITDGAIIFAKNLISQCKGSIVSTILSEISRVPKLDRELIDMDIKIEHMLKNSNENVIRSFL